MAQKLQANTSALTKLPLELPTESAGLAAPSGAPSGKRRNRAINSIQRAKRQKYLTKLEASLGGREELANIFRFSPQEQGRDLERLLSAEVFDYLPVENLLERAKIHDCHRFLVLLEEAKREKAKLEASLNRSEHLPRIMDDTCKDAMTVEGMCPDCYGEGIVIRARKEVKCPPCNGTGKVKLKGSIEDRKLVFQSAGLIGEKGPLVAFNTVIGGVPSLADAVVEATKVIEEKQ